MQIILEAAYLQIYCVDGFQGLVKQSGDAPSEIYGVPLS